MAAIQSKYRGLALPALRSAGGYFVAKIGKDKVWGDLLMTLFTPIGTRPMNRSFGSGIASMAFRPRNQLNPASVRLVVAGAANKWCPQAVIGNITSQVLKSGALQIGIRFAVAGETTNTAQAAPVASIAAAQAALAGKAI